MSAVADAAWAAVFISAISRRVAVAAADWCALDDHSPMDDMSQDVFRMIDESAEIRP